MFNSIGGIAPGAGNIIANNGGNGVSILGGANTPVSGNSTFSNGALGIDLRDDAGVTPNVPATLTPDRTTNKTSRSSRRLARQRSR